ncbi:MAG: bifunctional metallophosphatase/5'-nucleotidase, partial [Muribaculaceae bacterium]|nr:bifunctional metallophosphatase/5'-nucleotidase [Muribaculaceae bacterium]
VTASAAYSPLAAQQLVILHTNYTHSHIDPVDASDLGGVLRRKALIDSIRAAEPHVMVIDAGDIVQGTLYFHLYKGEVEQKAINAMGYDLQIMGNHEFDNGIESMAQMYAQATPTLLTTNYNLSATPLSKYFKPYFIKQIGDKKVGFIALNLNPKGMIADANSQGIELYDWKEAANSTAWHLKHNEKVDRVIAITHVGYSDEGTNTFNDTDIAATTQNIDAIIGGHSHTLIDPANPLSPAWKVKNAEGREIPVVQTGRWGEHVGKLVIDLSSDSTSYSIINVDKRFDNRIDPEFAALLAPYREVIDSLYHTIVAKSANNYSNRGPELLNFTSDFLLERGRQLAPNVNLAISNKGGIRKSLSKGNISEGDIIDMLPFKNNIMIIDINGHDLVEAFNVMASRGGDGVSDNVDIVFDPITHTCTSIKIDGK